MQVSSFNYYWYCWCPSSFDLIYNYTTESQIKFAWIKEVMVNYM